MESANYRRYCTHCERDVVICGKCGNNSCNGGHGEVDGKTCDQCPSAYKEDGTMSNGTWTVTVEEDEEGNSILPLPEEMLEQMDWREGDTLDFHVNGDETCTITNISWEERNKDKVA